MSNPRLVETPFHSPQLTLFDLGPGEWVLYWRVPDYAPRTRRNCIEGLVQPLLFDLPPAESGISEVQRFVKGLERGKEAVLARLTLMYSNGQVEGPVNKLKLPKRTMYGRAGFPLLRQSVLHAL